LAFWLQNLPLGFWTELPILISAAFNFHSTLQRLDRELGVSRRVAPGSAPHLPAPIDAEPLTLLHSALLRDLATDARALHARLTPMIHPAGLSYVMAQCSAPPAQAETRPMVIAHANPPPIHKQRQPTSRFGLVILLLLVLCVVAWLLVWPPAWAEAPRANFLQTVNRTLGAGTFGQAMRQGATELAGTLRRGGRWLHGTPAVQFVSDWIDAWR
jgi:hypothetical protein